MLARSIWLSLLPLLLCRLLDRVVVLGSILSLNFQSSAVVSSFSWKFTTRFMVGSIEEGSLSRNTKKKPRSTKSVIGWDKVSLPHIGDQALDWIMHEEMNVLQDISTRKMSITIETSPNKPFSLLLFYMIDLTRL